MVYLKDALKNSYKLRLYKVSLKIQGLPFM